MASIIIIATGSTKFLSHELQVPPFGSNDLSDLLMTLMFEEQIVTEYLSLIFQNE
jgi:hypothetical protein